MNNETTKNTLLEAHNAALRAELDDARRELGARDAADRKVSALEQQLTDCRRKLERTEKLNVQLTANQPTAEQLKKLKSYREVAGVLDMRTEELNASRKAYGELNDKFFEQSEEFAESDSINEKLRDQIYELEAKAWKTKWRLSSTIAVLIGIVCMFAGLIYLDKQQQAAAPPSLSAESRAAFDRLPDEQKRMINKLIRAEQSIASQPNPLGSGSK